MTRSTQNPKVSSPTTGTSATPHSASATPTHTFQDIQSYTVVLTVTDDNGASDTDSLVINALDPGGPGQRRHRR